MTDIFDKVKLYVSGRKGSYQRVFNGPSGQDVLLDLARFCRAHSSTFHPDPRMAAQLDGRREVWLRIQQHLQLSDDQLWELFGSPNQPKRGE